MTLPANQKLGVETKNRLGPHFLRKSKGNQKAKSERGGRGVEGHDSAKPTLIPARNIRHP